MKAAFEPISDDHLVWACARTSREARREAARRASEYHEERIPSSYFSVRPATSVMVEETAQGGTIMCPGGRRP